MKRSRAVPLILLGTLTLLSACGRDDPVQVKQHAYATREDCLSDWGRDEKDCRPARSGGGYYMGPRYYWHHAGGHPVAINEDGSTRALRNTYLNRTGAKSTAIHTSTTTARISSRYTGGGMRMGGGTGKISRGGFGGMARGFAGG